MIPLMIALVMNNAVTVERQRYIQRRPFNPHELLVLKELPRKKLLYLMVFCDIRIFNEVPVAAMTDDELRMAYVVWRGEGQRDVKARISVMKRKLRYARDVALEFIERGATL